MYKRLPLKIFSGSGNIDLTREVCRTLGTRVAEADVTRFNDGEVNIQLKGNVRGADVFIVASTPPPAENFFELVFLADAARTSSARRITLIIPYLGYSRQDKKKKSRVPLSARYISKMISISGANRALFLDLHSEEATVNALNKEVIPDHIYTSYVTVPYLKQIQDREDFTIAAPDKGGGPRAEAYADFLGCDNYVDFAKSRPAPGKIDEKRIHIIGDVNGKNLLFVDDIIDTGGTLMADAMAAKKAGAQKLFACAAHGVFSKNAIANFDEQNLFTEIIVTDSIYQDPEKIKTKNVKITVLSVAPLLARAIDCIHKSESISRLIL